MTKEIYNRMSELESIMENAANFEEYNAAYQEWLKMDEQQHLEYVARNESAFKEFCEKHINGKALEDIPADVLQQYSDWHKDLYGRRPQKYR